MFNWEKALFIKQKQWLLILLVIPAFLVSLLVSNFQEELGGYTYDLGVLQARLAEQNELTPEMESQFTTIYELERKELAAVLFKQRQENLLAILVEKSDKLKELLPLLPLQTTSINLEPLEGRIKLYQYAIDKDIDLMSSEGVLQKMSGIIYLFTYNIAGLIFMLMVVQVLGTYLKHPSIVEKVYSQRKLQLGRFAFLFLVGYCVPLLLFMVGFLVIGLMNGVNPFILPISYYSQTGLMVTSIGAFLVQSILYQVLGLLVIYQLVRLFICLGADLPLILIALVLGWLPVMVSSSL